VVLGVIISTTVETKQNNLLTPQNTDGSDRLNIQIKSVLSGLGACT